jgi:hypothetical protein
MTISVPTAGNAIQPNDFLIIIIESTNTATTAGTPTRPSDWALIHESTQGAGATGCTTLTVWGKRGTGTETDLTVTGASNHMIGAMFVYSGVKANVTTPWNVGSGNGAATGNGTMLGLNTPEANCMVLMICASSRDAASGAQFSGWANAALSGILEREDETMILGSGGGFGMAEGLKATAGATGNSTVTIATSEPWRSVHVALQPHTAANVSSTLTNTVGLTDVVSNSRALLRTISNTLGITDFIDYILSTGGASYFVTITSTVGFTTAVSKSRTLVRTLANTVGFTTSISRARTLFRTLTNTLGLMTSVTRSRGIRVVLSDILGFVDSLAAAVSEVFSKVSQIILLGSRSLYRTLSGKRSMNATLKGSKITDETLHGSVDQ